MYTNDYYNEKCDFCCFPIPKIGSSGTVALAQLMAVYPLYTFIFQRGILSGSKLEQVGKVVWNSYLTISEN